MMRSSDNLDQLLGSMEVSVHHLETRPVLDEHRPNPPPLNAILVHYVLDGTVISRSGRVQRSCGPGSMIITPPGIELELLGTGDARTRVAASLVVARLSGAFGLLDHAKVPVVEDMSNSPMIRFAWDAMVSEALATRQALGGKALLSALMKTCILSVLRRFFQRPGINPRIVSALADPRLSGAVAWILHEPGAPHSVASLANAAGLGRSTFARQFSQALGSSPMEFVVKTRLHYAAGMLRSSRMPIKTIAASIGFASRSHFSHAFRELYGSDPRAYRRQGPEACG